MATVTLETNSSFKDIFRRHNPLDDRVFYGLGRFESETDPEVLVTCVIIPEKVPVEPHSQFHCVLYCFSPEAQAHLFPNNRICFIVQVEEQIGAVGVIDRLISEDEYKSIKEYSDK